MIWFFILSGFVYYMYRFLYAKPSLADNAQSKPATELPTIPPIHIPPTSTISPRDQIAVVVETVDWLNDITRICWPQICKIVESQLSPTLEPLINLYLPKPFSKFRFTDVDLGKEPLKVGKVVVHRRFKDSIAMDLDVTFKGRPTMNMKCSPIKATFGIKELNWTSRLSILMRPLLPTLPLVGAIQASMITHPEIDMDFTGIINFADFGPVEKVVRSVLKDVIASMIVLPNRFLYKLVDSLDYFDVYYPPLGVIVITIERGRGFTKEKKIGLIKAIPDLYCKASFGLDRMKTPVQMNNLEPEWGTKQHFILSDFEQPFELKCYDKDTITRDDLVGSFSLKAQDLLSDDGAWFPLLDNIDNKIAKHGEIYVKTRLLKYQDPRDPIVGKCVVTILIDRARNLHPNTKSAACKVTIGSDKKKIVRETPQISEPREPIPGIDPVNPVWNFSFDILIDDFSFADVVLDVVDGNYSMGKVVIKAIELEASDSNVTEGEFDLGNGASLRAKVMLHGLIPDGMPNRPSLSGVHPAPSSSRS